MKKKIKGNNSHYSLLYQNQYPICSPIHFIAMQQVNG